MLAGNAGEPERENEDETREWERQVRYGEMKTALKKRRNSVHSQKPLV